MKPNDRFEITFESLPDSIMSVLGDPAADPAQMPHHVAKIVQGVNSETLDPSEKVSLWEVRLGRVNRQLTRIRTLLGCWTYGELTNILKGVDTQTLE